MAIIKFPPHETADSSGLLAVGGDLDPIPSTRILTRDLSLAIPREFAAWFSPPKRAILFLKDLHVSRSLEKENRKSKLTFKINSCFEEVIRECAKVKNRGEQEGTWISEEMIAAYIEFHKAGYAHSFEAFDGENLVGGLYGVSVGKMFAGESMFYRAPNASKLAFLFLCDILKSKNVEWVDTQVMTPHFKSFGAVEILRADFLKMLAVSLSKDKLVFDNA